jgi:hypothetical protein
VSGVRLGGPVAFAGSRHGSPWSPVPAVAAVLAAGGVPVVGCASGVDQTVRLAAGSSGVVLRAAELYPHLPVQAALAERTRRVVSCAHTLAVFPGRGGAIGPGSALAIRTALELGLPVWVAGPRPVGSGWRPLTLAGVSGWLRVSSQPPLF